jgi:hypothetical protein
LFYHAINCKYLTPNTLICFKAKTKAQKVSSNIFYIKVIVIYPGDYKVKEYGSKKKENKKALPENPERLCIFNPLPL